MKRLIAALCALLLLVGCSQVSSSAPASAVPSSAAPASSVAASSASQQQSASASVAAPSEATPSSAPPMSSEPPSSSETMKDISNDSITINLPSSILDNPETFDPDSFSKDRGFDKTVINPDGSVSITMKKSTHKKFIADYSKKVDAALDELVNAEDTPYIKAITADKDYRTIVVKVDKKAYDETMFDFTPLVVGTYAMIYQRTAAIDQLCEVFVQDYSTGQTIGSVVYPDALESASQSASNPPKTESETPPIAMKDIALEKWILEPNSIGDVYLVAKYTNNTNKVIKDISFKVLLKDSNETVYLSNSDTVLPGETSPNFESFGPKTQSMDDVQILTCDVTLHNDDGTSTYISYDNKLGIMEWSK